MVDVKIAEPKHVLFTLRSGFVKYQDFAANKEIIFEPYDECHISLIQPVACKVVGEDDCVLIVRNNDVQIAYFKRSEVKFDKMDQLPWISIEQNQEVRVSASIVFAFRQFTEEDALDKHAAIRKKIEALEAEENQFDFRSDCGGGDIID